MKHTRQCIMVFCVLISALGTQAQVEIDSLMSAPTVPSHVKFQNHFYEALKQKALENYSKALKELVACKAIDSLESVVFHELVLKKRRVFSEMIWLSMPKKLPVLYLQENYQCYGPLQRGLSLINL